MFYYLLDKSSFLSNQDKTKKMTTILITGTIIYIVFHFILSNLNNTNLTKYFWVLFCMDVAAILINSKMDSELIFNKDLIDNKPKSILKKDKEQKNKELIEKKVKFKEIEELNEIESKDEPNEEEKIESREETIEEKVEIKKPKKKKSRKSTPISELMKENNEEKKETSQEDEINITLADLQSDAGSDLDLDSFEKDFFQN